MLAYEQGHSPAKQKHITGSNTSDPLTWESCCCRSTRRHAHVVTHGGTFAADTVNPPSACWSYTGCTLKGCQLILLMLIAAVVILFSMGISRQVNAWATWAETASRTAGSLSLLIHHVGEERDMWGISLSLTHAMGSGVTNDSFSCVSNTSSACFNAGLSVATAEQETDKLLSDILLDANVMKALNDLGLVRLQLVPRMMTKLRLCNRMAMEQFWQLSARRLQSGIGADNPVGSIVSAARYMPSVIPGADHSDGSSTVSAPALTVAAKAAPKEEHLPSNDYNYYLAHDIEDNDSGHTQQVEESIGSELEAGSEEFGPGWREMSSMSAGIAHDSELRDGANGSFPTDGQPYTSDTCGSLFQEFFELFPTRQLLGDKYPGYMGEVWWKSQYLVSFTAYTELISHLFESLQAHTLRIESIAWQHKPHTTYSDHVVSMLRGDAGADYDVGFTLSSMYLLTSHTEVAVDLMAHRGHMISAIAVGYFADTYDRRGVHASLISYLRTYTKYVLALPLANMTAGKKLANLMSEVAPLARSRIVIGGTVHAAVRKKAITTALRWAASSQSSYYGMLTTGRFGFYFAALANYTAAYTAASSLSMPAFGCLPGCPHHYDPEACFGAGRLRDLDAVSVSLFGGVPEAVAVIFDISSRTIESMRLMGTAMSLLVNEQAQAIRSNADVAVRTAVSTMVVCCVFLIASAVVGAAILSRQRKTLAALHTRSTADMLAHVSSENLREPLNGLEMASALLKELADRRKHSMVPTMPPSPRTEPSPIASHLPGAIDTGTPVIEATSGDAASCGSSGHRHIWSPSMDIRPASYSDHMPTATPYSQENDHAYTLEDDEEVELVRSIDDCINKLKVYRSTLVDTAKVLSGRPSFIRPRSATMDLGQVLHAAVQQGRELLSPLTAVDVIFDSPQGLPKHVTVDELRLQHIINTIMSTAVASIHNHSKVAKLDGSTITALILRAHIVPLLVACDDYVDTHRNPALEPLPAKPGQEVQLLLKSRHSHVEYSHDFGAQHTFGIATPATRTSRKTFDDWNRGRIPLLSIDGNAPSYQYLESVLSHRDAVSEMISIPHILVLDFIMNLPFGFGMQSAFDFHVLEKTVAPNFDASPATLFADTNTQAPQQVSLAVCRHIAHALGGDMWLDHAQQADLLAQTFRRGKHGQRAIVDSDDMDVTAAAEIRVDERSALKTASYEYSADYSHQGVCGSDVVVHLDRGTPAPEAPAAQSRFSLLRCSRRQLISPTRGPFAGIKLTFAVPICVLQQHTAGAKVKAARNSEVHVHRQDAWVEPETMQQMRGHPTSAATIVHNPLVEPETIRRPHLPPGNGVGANDVLRTIHHPKRSLVSPIGVNTEAAPPPCLPSRPLRSPLIQRARIPSLLAPGEQLRILYADGDEMTRRLTCRALQRHCHAAVDSAEGGQQAIDAVLAAVASDRCYHLLLIGVVMPGKTGVDVIRTLRAARVDTPAIAVAEEDSIWWTDEDNPGFDDAVQKPVNLQHFKSLISKWVKEAEGQPLDRTECHALTTSVRGT